MRAMADDDSESCNGHSAKAAAAAAADDDDEKLTAKTPHPPGRDEARRARKRATDRKSQQNHRRRQKAYVKQLEESKKAFEEQCEADSDGRFATLVESHRKLELRYRNAVSLLNRVRIVLDGGSESDPHIAAPVVVHGGEDRREDADAAIPLTHDPPSCDGEAPEPTPEISFIDPDSLNPSSAGHGGTDGSILPRRGPLSGPMSAPIFPDPATLDPTTTTTETSVAGEGDETVSRHLDFGNSQASPSLDALLSGGDLELFATSSSMNTSSVAEPAPLMGFPLVSLANNVLLHGAPPEPWSTRSLYCRRPLHSPPMAKGALLLDRMVTEARAEHASGRFGHDEQPSLGRILTDGSGDVLAFRLFHFLSAYGEMPMHLFLGIFWVQYLVLRWLALGSEADYLRIPRFMRPQIVECQIPHSILIDLFVWPDLRHALIKQSADMYAEAIGVDLVKFLKPSWAPVMPSSSGHLRGSPSNLASIDVMSMVERQAESWDFWKVDPGFVRQYTQFIDCQLE
ncbi:hypothetical protein F4778DRAFT_746955 [Xylariomycetidae sp. FL2044]|nr:hypothetical protein F4778DRAFT_746955 [Xylariomycetidae sp. FL2044]